jgi:hypothetical protein
VNGFLSASIAPRLDLTLLRRDFFDGFSLLLQDEDGLPLDLNEVNVCAAVWKQNSTSSYSQVTSINVERQESLRAGCVRLWLSSAQTATIWDEAERERVSGESFFPNVYDSEALTDSGSSLFWDVRIEKTEELSDLVSVSAGTFVSQTNHGLGATERVIFRDTAQSSINNNDTSARIYSGLTGITYEPPYSFTIASLSGVTDAAVGGSVYRLKQDTVMAGAVIISTTLSNCFSYDYETFLRPLVFDFTKPLTLRRVIGSDVANQRFLFLIL